MMPIIDPLDRFFNQHHSSMKDTFNLFGKKIQDLNVFVPSIHFRLKNQASELGPS